MRRPRAANAAVLPQVVYGVDPYGAAIARGLVDDALHRLNGGTAYVGPDGNPTEQFTGYATAQPHVTRAIGGVANHNVYRDSSSSSAGIESSVAASGGLLNPAQRMFADRLRRRSSL